MIATAVLDALIDEVTVDARPPWNASTGTSRSTPTRRTRSSKRIADEHSPGVYCVRNPVQLTTHLVA